jgi:hypothetical protein
MRKGPQAKLVMAAARKMNEAANGDRDFEIFDISDTQHGYGVFICIRLKWHQVQEWDNDS